MGVLSRVERMMDLSRPFPNLDEPHFDYCDRELLLFLKKLSEYFEETEPKEYKKASESFDSFYQKLQKGTKEKYEKMSEDRLRLIMEHSKEEMMSLKQIFVNKKEELEGVIQKTGTMDRVELMSYLSYLGFWLRYEHDFKIAKMTFSSGLGQMETTSMEFEKMKQSGLEAAKPILYKKCKRECESRGLPKGKTLRPEVKYEIAQAIGINDIGTLETFKSGQRAYQKISTILSNLGYKQRRRTPL